MLTSEIVQQVRRLQIRTNRQVADVLAGAYHSVFKGRGVEFDEVRPYVPGDDVRTHLVELDSSPLEDGVVGPGQDVSDLPVGTDLQASYLLDDFRGQHQGNPSRASR